jgi:hypothetical protein
MARKSVTFTQQSAQLTELHCEDSDVAALALQVARDPLRRVDLAFKAFFRRVKSGEAPGYPRFSCESSLRFVHVRQRAAEHFRESHPRP